MNLIQVTLIALLCSNGLSAMRRAEARKQTRFNIAQKGQAQVGQNLPTYEELERALQVSFDQVKAPQSSPAKVQQEPTDPELELAIQMSLEQDKAPQPLSADAEQMAADHELALQASLEQEQIAADHELALTLEGNKQKDQKKPTPPNAPSTISKKPFRRTQHAAAAAAPVKPRITNVTDQSQITLPPVLSHIPNIVIHHCRVEQQGSLPQCGSRAVINAVSIQNLLETHRPITSTAIQQEAAKLKHLYKPHALNFDEAIKLAREVRLDHAYILTYYEKNITQGLSPFVIVGSTDDMSGENSLDEIALLSTCTAHFICNTGGHWVCISLVKKDGEASHIFYTDSCNGKLANTSRATHFIQFICENFLIIQ